MRRVPERNLLSRATWLAVAYLLPNAFTVAGADATAAFPAGTVVFDPVAGRVSAVWMSEYVSGNTNVYLMDDICWNGMPTVGYYPATTALKNLCTGGAALSGGYYSSQAPSYAFDTLAFCGVRGGGSGTTLWASSQFAAAVNGAAWIGYDFGAGNAQAIRWFNIQQNVSGAYTPVTSVFFEHSDDGSAWTTHATVALSSPVAFELKMIPAPAAAHRYWRIRANSTTSQYWGVQQFQMGV